MSEFIGTFTLCRHQMTVNYVPLGPEKEGPAQLQTQLLRCEIIIKAVSAYKKFA